MSTTNYRMLTRKYHMLMTKYHMLTTKHQVLRTIKLFYLAMQATLLRKKQVITSIFKCVFLSISTF